jgi:hypothetical protein
VSEEVATLFFRLAAEKPGVGDFGKGFKQRANALEQLADMTFGYTSNRCLQTLTFGMLFHWSLQGGTLPSSPPT